LNLEWDLSIHYEPWRPGGRLRPHLACCGMPLVRLRDQGAPPQRNYAFRTSICFAGLLFRFQRATSEETANLAGSLSAVKSLLRNRRLHVSTRGGSGPIPVQVGLQLPPWPWGALALLPASSREALRCLFQRSSRGQVHRARGRFVDQRAHPVKLWLEDGRQRAHEHRGARRHLCRSPNLPGPPSSTPWSSVGLAVCLRHHSGKLESSTREVRSTASQALPIRTTRTDCLLHPLPSPSPLFP